MSINVNDTTPAAPAGSTNVNWQVDSDGNLSGYVTTAVELAEDNVDSTGLSDNVPSTTLIASPSNRKYRVSASLIVTTVDGASSTLPSLVLTWNDQDNGQPQSLTLTPTDSGNLQTTFQENDAILNVGSSADVSYSTTGYASGTPNTMLYALHIRVEIL